MNRAPSAPSQFSPELEVFIVTKYDPLLTIVKELGDHVQQNNKEVWRLERKMAELERQLQRVTETLEEGAPAHRNLDATQIDDDEAHTNLLKDEASLSAPWLFSCQAGTPMSAIQVLLEFTPDCTEEIDVRLWTNEEDMWIALLEDLPIAVTRPDTVQLPDLRKSARHALLELCRSEYLLLLRGVPGKGSAATNPVVITLVAIMAAAFSEAWQRVEAQAPDDLGRIAVVLEGDCIGSRLRGGRQKFDIEKLN
eukprot:Lankesteria_metandrocarpae@DN3398_c0_g1_i4.p1